MDRPHVSLKYERTFPYPVSVAYAWLTDYQDDDPQRAGTVIKSRNVVRRSDREVEVDAELEIVGKPARGRATIHLYPEEHRWIAIIGKGAWQFDYRLEPAGPNAARLKVDYKVGSRRWTRRAMTWLAKPIILRRLDRMWANFDAAMRRELGPAPTPAPL